MSELSINTTQNVAINFNAASVGDRILGFVLDLLILAAYATLVEFVFFYWLDIDGIIAGGDYWSNRALEVVFYLPAIFYTLIFENIFDGQTIGKRIMKVRVIKIDGYQAGFGDYFIRWIMRLVDIWVMTGLIGLITMLVSKKVQRLGDMAAGTAIISLKNNITIDHTILQEIESDYVPTYPLVIKLTDNDMRIIKETYESSLRTADFAMIAKLENKIESVTGIRSISGNATAFIDTIIKDYNYYTQKM